MVVVRGDIGGSNMASPGSIVFTCTVTSACLGQRQLTHPALFPRAGLRLDECRVGGQGGTGDRGLGPDDRAGAVDSSRSARCAMQCAFSAVALTRSKGDGSPLLGVAEGGWPGIEPAATLLVEQGGDKHHSDKARWNRGGRPARRESPGAGVCRRRSAGIPFPCDGESRT